MDTFWIIFIFIGLFATNLTSGQSEVEVTLAMKKYVEKGSSVTIFCEHNVKHEILYKVLWLKVGHGKLFEYVRVRNNPFRNFSIPGAEIDWSDTDDTKLTLKNLDFNASGHYYCEVSTDTPIFTKPSSDEPLIVYLAQSGPPSIKFRKKPPYFLEDKLIALCNTSRARPSPHITWLINGKRVEEKYIKRNPLKDSHRSKIQHSSHKTPPSSSVDGHHHDNVNNNNNNNQKIIKGASSYGYAYGYDELPQPRSTHHHDGHHHSGTSTINMNNPYNVYTGQQANRRSYDNKYYELRKHRNSFNHKFRRYVSENSGSKKSNNMENGNNNSGTSIAGAGGISDLSWHGSNNEGSGYSGLMYGGNGGGGSSSGAFAALAAAAAATNSATPGGSISTRYHLQHYNGSVSTSQLYIEIQPHHIDSNGRLEITCLATIPAHVAVGEQFADYKTHSVKIDVENRKAEAKEIPFESTEITPAPSSGIGYLGNGSFGISIHQLLPLKLLVSCLIIMKI